MITPASEASKGGSKSIDKFQQSTDHKSGEIYGNENERGQMSPRQGEKV